MIFLKLKYIIFLRGAIDHKQESKWLKKVNEESLMMIFNILDVLVFFM